MAISYDSQAILANFSERQHIRFPLLSDPDSSAIKEFEVLNAEATGIARGMAHPGYFYLDRAGIIVEKFFESAYTDRLTANNLLGKIFPELMEGEPRSIETPYIRLSLRQSDRVVVPGNRVTLVADIELPPDVHVYAPGVSGYKQISLEITPAPELRLLDARYPKPKILFMKAIREKVPVFEGHFQIVQDVVISSAREFQKSVGEGRPLHVQGRLLYQACSSKICYMPKDATLDWELRVLPLDGQRAPKEIQHR